MNKIWMTALWSCLAIVGAFLFYWSGQLSARYSAWSTGVREGHANFDPPPPKLRVSKIAVGIFRLLGAVLVLLSIAWLYSIS